MTHCEFLCFKKNHSLLQIACCTALSILAAGSFSFVTLGQPASTYRVSVSNRGEEANDYSNRHDVSGDGKVVAFRSFADNLVSGDGNETYDVFARDVEAGVTTLISSSSEGVAGNLGSLAPALSRNGRFIAFQSDATNLVEGDRNNTSDIFLHDRLSGETIRVSIASDGGEGNAISWGPSLSSDGRLIFFLSDASNLTTDDANGSMTDLFFHDRLTRKTSRLPLGPEGIGPDSLIRGGSVSDDGLRVAFNTDASNLVEGDTNGISDCFLHDRQTGETTRISLNSSGEEGNGACQRARISGDGRFVVFDSDASNLVESDSNGVLDIFVHEIRTGETTRISIASSGEEANSWSRNAVLSYDGRFASYFSEASNLVADDTNGSTDVVRFDRFTGETIRLSVSSEDQEGDLSSGYPHISDDGGRVIFQSNSTNLIEDDTNGVLDIYLREIPRNEVYFAQFGDGEGLLFSQILLLNRAQESQTGIRIYFRDPEGNPLPVDLNGVDVAGEMGGSLAPAGVAALQTDGVGELSVGSVTVESDWPVDGVILFGGIVGLAGVGQSIPLQKGFTTPVETRQGRSALTVRTGIAVMNLNTGPTTLTILLRNHLGQELAQANKKIAKGGQLAVYIDELDWSAIVDFSSFKGSVTVTADGSLAATAIQTRPGQFATLPVVPLE